MVKLDLKGSIDHGFGQGAFLVAPLGGIWVRPAHLPLNPPPGLPAIVHHLFGLAKCVQLWGFQRLWLHSWCAPGLAGGVPTH